MHWVGPDGIILRANRAELEMLGYDPRTNTSVATSPSSTSIARRDRRHPALAWRRRESLVGYPAQMRCKDGSIKDVLINSSVLWEQGRFVHTRCFTLDVTARNRSGAGARAAGGRGRVVR